MLVKTSTSKRFDNAAKNRKIILDFLNENPGSTLYQIYWATDLSRAKISQYLLRMKDYNEVRCDNEGRSLQGRKCLRWFPMVETTTSPSEMIDRVAKNLGIGKPKLTHKYIFGGLRVE